MNRIAFNWIRTSWDAVRTSLWALPALMFLAGAVLAALMLRLGSAPLFGEGAAQWVSSGSGEDARNLLSTLLTAIISLAGIVFSITVVSLSLAANSYGPRLIRTFRSSLSTQIVMGILTMTIVYLLLVLRAVRGDMDAGEVPEAAVVLGSVLALVSVLALLAFIQGVATLVVADEVVRRVRRELDSAIEELPALAPGRESRASELPDDFQEQAGKIRLPREGYVQSVTYSKLVDWAEQRDVVVRLDFRPGDYVVEGDHKVLVYPPPADPERARSEIAKFIVSGNRRTPTQDLEFAIRHLVEVAVRALSPGINDPFTAMAVIDRLRGALARLCRRELPRKRLVGPTGQLRVSRDATSYRGAVDAALHQIRQSGAGKPSILVHMLKAIGAISEHVQTSEQREALAHHARLIQAAGARNLDDPRDQEDVEREFRKAMEALALAADDELRDATLPDQDKAAGRRMSATRA